MIKVEEEMLVLQCENVGENVINVINVEENVINVNAWNLNNKGCQGSQ